MKKIFLLFTFALSLALSGTGQKRITGPLNIVTGTVGTGTVGIGTTTTDGSAALEIISTDRGFLPPRMSTVFRNLITLPAKGLVIYNTTTDQLEFNSGTPGAPVWVAAGGAVTTLYTGDGSLGGDRIVTQAGFRLQYTASAVDAFSVDGTTFSVDASNNRVGIGDAAPVARLELVGTGATSSTYSFQSHNSTGTSFDFAVRDDGFLGSGVSTPTDASHRMEWIGGTNEGVAVTFGTGSTRQSLGGTVLGGISFKRIGDTYAATNIYSLTVGADANLAYQAATNHVWFTNVTERMRLTTSGRLILGQPTPAGHILEVLSNTQNNTHSVGHFSNTNTTVGFNYTAVTGLVTGVRATGNNIAAQFTASGSSGANYGLLVTAGDVGIGTSVPNTQLDVQGGQTWNVTNVAAATYDLLITDHIVQIDFTTTAAHTSFTLPTAQTVAGRIVTIVDGDGNAGTNNITIDTEGGQLINGSATNVISTNFGFRTLYSDGTDWFIIGN